MAQVGDLVTSTAKELNPPRALSGEISPGSMFFGIVVISLDPNTVDFAWSHVELGHKSSDIVKPDIGRCGDDLYVVVCVDRRLVRIVAKNDNGNVDNVNHFFEIFCLHIILFQT